MKNAIKILSFVCFTFLFVNTEELGNQPPNRGKIFRKKTGIFANPAFLEEGARLYSGDIKLTDEDVRTLQEKACMVSADLQWPKTGETVRIPYAIYSLGDKGKEIMKQVADEYRKHTCIDLQEVHPYNEEYELAVVNYGGCASWMGKKNFSEGYQLVNLSPFCEDFRTMLHEFGHAIGLFHEHERPDRDQYISFNLSNVYPEQRHNYKLSSCNTVGTEYDLTSIMHYDYKGFSAEGRIVIGVKQIDQQYLLGMERNELSHRDKVTINKLYGCIDDWEKKCRKTKNPCKNEGYINRNCQCVCPRGTKGKNCEIRSGTYYPPNPLNCGGNITSPIEIQNVPGGKVGDCIWTIRAPAGKKVRLSIVDLRLIDNCYSITLNVRQKDKYLGNTYCMTSEIAKGDHLDSVDNFMVVHWENKYPYDYGRFRGKITFIK